MLLQVFVLVLLKNMLSFRDVFYDLLQRQVADLVDHYLALVSGKDQEVTAIS